MWRRPTLEQKWCNPSRYVICLVGITYLYTLWKPGPEPGPDAAEPEQFDNPLQEKAPGLSAADTKPINDGAPDDVHRPIQRRLVDSPESQA